MVCYILLLFLVSACTALASVNGRQARESQIRNTLLATFGSSDLYNHRRLEDLSRCQENCENNETSGISPKCYCDVCQYERGLGNKESYAMEMFDAMGRFPSGLLKANFKWIGTHTECIRATDRELNITNFKAKYCLALYTIPNATITLLEEALSMALCVPNTCSKDDVRLLIQKDLLSRPRIHSIMHNAFDFSLVHCNESKDLSVGAIIMICISAVLGVLVLSASGFEYYNLQRTTKTLTDLSNTGIEETAYNVSGDQNTGLKVENVANVWKQLLSCFSVVSNGPYILSVNIKDPGEDSMSVLYGLRVLSLWWMLLGQTFFFHYKFMYNFFDIRVILDRIISQAMVNYRYAEDTFFILSGLLITYYPLSRLHANGKENWVYFYLHRLWRISIPYFLAFFAYVCLIEYMCTGALSYYIEENLSACHDTWWSYVLYINNLYPYPGSVRGGAWQLFTGYIGHTKDTCYQQPKHYCTILVVNSATLSPSVGWFTHV
ncbi:nose resistant to fluoxetine protein 6-like [Saccoglossus kowalevskii]